MDPDKELIEFVQQNPVCYAIMRSPAHMSVLQSLAKGAKGKVQLLIAFPRIESADIDLIVDSLVEGGLLGKMEVGSNQMYYVNETGKQFLAIFNRTKKDMIGAEKRV